MARALAVNDTNPADQILRPKSEAFLYKLDDMEFKDVIKINKQQYENWTNFPDLLVCIVGIDDEQQLENYFELLMSWAKLVKNKSKKIIFIMNNSKFLEKSMMKTRMVYVLKVKFTELWKEYDGKNYCHENKVGYNDSDIFDNAVSKAVNEAMKNIKAKEETSVTSPSSIEEEFMKVASIIKLQGVTSVSSVDNQGNTPLHLAAGKGQNKIVKALLVCDAEKESENKDGCTPLHLAVNEGHHEVISTLLENNANVNAINSVGRTPLHMACCTKNPRSVELLLKFGANIETKDNYGHTPLHFASSLRGGSNVAVTTLLAHGSNINAQDNKGQTPLHHAIEYSNKQGIEILLENGADPNLKNNSKQNAIDYANQYYIHSIPLFEKHAASVK
ncbi:unnamed protein product [Ceutorhynchus assimilis]|uniref:Uncharacterized protein n=1 Tax=Ceutorhynchus assimilis TaxID=467358 RepID=A0A9N9ME18_9CUCU|nr:unnamed protein product [Ceutorhynchus assimilis]